MREACRGGGIARQPCGQCSGSGRHEQRFAQGVRIPPGVRGGDLLQAAARSSGGEALALEIRIAVRAHDVLELLDDGSLRCEVPVDGFAWVAGREAEVPTLEGLHTVRLSPAQLVYRLEGRGFPLQRRGPRGDLWITVVPVFPDPLDAAQQALIERLIATNRGRDGKPKLPRLRDWERRLRR